jgi:acyl carrier protein
MSDQAVRDIILGIIAVVAPDADLADVKNDVRLRDQLELDSMDFLDIVMELRKRYKIEVPKEDYPQLATLDRCVAYLSPKFAAMATA